MIRFVFGISRFHYSLCGCQMHTRLVAGFIDGFSDGVSNFCKGESAFLSSADVDKTRTAIGKKDFSDYLS